MSESVSSMKKWGIPEQKKKAPEITLLERLVWVKYMSHWWPALIYHSYTELQQHLYDQLDMVLKAQFAMAIMRQVQEKRKIKVARLLGRPILEVIEVEEDCYCEFYWQLPNVLPKACRVSRYGENEDLFLDFHRALDQVEDIIREVSQENFALVPNGDQQTWLQRAKAVLQNGDDASTVNFLNPLSSPAEKEQPLNQVPKSISGTKSVQRKTQSRAIPSLTTSPSRSSTIATNDVGVWDSFVNRISNSFDGGSVQVGAVAPRQGEASSESDGAGSSGEEAAHVAAGTVPTKQKRDRLSSSRSGKSKTSRGTDKVDNRTSTKNKKAGRTAIEPKIPAVAEFSSDSETDTNNAKKQTTKSSSSRSSKHSKNVADESREPPCPERTPFEAHAASRATKSPHTIHPPSAVDRAIVTRNEVLPGLEGDDIIPGLSARVAGAQNIWAGVLNTMTVSRGSDASPDKDASQKQDGERSRGEGQRDPEAQAPVRDDSIQKTIQRALAAEGTPQEEAEIVVRDAKAQLSFWQRLTCMGDV